MKLAEILLAHKEWLTSNRLKGCKANLRGANLSGADLSKADLRGANLNHTKFSLEEKIKLTIGENFVPNEEGDYTFFKKVDKTLGKGIFSSIYDRNFFYRIGEISEVSDYDEDVNISCGKGIHVSNETYWNEGDALIKVEVRKDDIITCIDGKCRVKKCKTIEVIILC